MQRWIQHLPDGRQRRGTGDPPTEGEVHFIGTESTISLVQGVLRRDGQPAPQGEHAVTLPDSAAPIKFAVDPTGKAKRVIPTKPARAAKGGGTTNA